MVSQTLFFLRYIPVTTVYDYLVSTTNNKVPSYMKGANTQYRRLPQAFPAMQPAAFLAPFATAPTSVQHVRNRYAPRAAAAGAPTRARAGPAAAAAEGIRENGLVSSAPLYSARRQRLPSSVRCSLQYLALAAVEGMSRRC